MIDFDQDLRVKQLQDWLHKVLEQENWSLEIASADASFRRYFRIKLHEQSLIAMDAPPDKEDIRPFIEVANAFSDVGVNVPEILARDVTQGFMLLEDFGSTSYLGILDADNVDVLYGDALEALLQLQSASRDHPEKFPPYDAPLLQREMALFRDWFLERHLSLVLAADEQAILDVTFTLLTDKALQQPIVWVHRDYHSRNLMHYPTKNPGIIDFQDAVTGPVTYDLVSLLRDCYINWPAEQVHAWVDDYLAELRQTGLCRDVSAEQFQEWFDFMGMQRHLKAIGIFSRLNYRDAKPGYLADIPRTLAYVEQVASRYPQLAEFRQFLNQRISPALQELSQ